MNLKSIAQTTFDTKLFIVYSVFFSVIIGMLFVLSVLINDSATENIGCAWDE
ncbi:MAG: hypothetical protein WAM41_02790 [Psychrobacillus psychrotolerans]|uniref:hypothetical protein n=1 Tax=Psychrobacillus psychrotolerans TaxID=126156 RepID=UPI003BB0EC3A